MKITKTTSMHAETLDRENGGIFAIIASIDEDDKTSCNISIGSTIEKGIPGANTCFCAYDVPADDIAWLIEQLKQASALLK